MNALPLTWEEIRQMAEAHFGGEDQGVAIDIRCANDRVFVNVFIGEDHEGPIYYWCDGAWHPAATRGSFYIGLTKDNDTIYHPALESAVEMHSSRLKPLRRRFLRAGVRIESNLDHSPGLWLVRALDEVPLAVDLGDGVARAQLTLAQLEIVDTSIFARKQHVIVGAK